jgi:bifunctional aspartokinase / homoserine dehydrogenase 1
MSSNAHEFTPGDWVVHKFGGTSVGSSSCMSQCIEIIKPLIKSQRVAVVVSAMGGKPKVTDLLLDSVHAAAADRQDEIEAKLDNIHTKHQICVAEILINAPDAAQKILLQIKSDLKDIADLLKAVTLMKTPHEQILELVSGYGEIWSASIMTEAMKCADLPFIFVNARDVLLVSEDSLGTKVHWEESEEKLKNFVAEADAKYLLTEKGREMSESSAVALPHLMITGYIASSLNGVATTLKRDGSDFSASIFGKMLRASGITIWTDVSGVYSADPRKVPEAQIIPEVSYTEAIELAYFGAKVIHPKT